MKIKNRLKKILRKVVKNKFLQCFVAGVAVVFLLMFWQFGWQSPVREMQTFVIPCGTSVGAVARDVKQRNLVASDKVFKMMVRLHGGKVQCGQYDIPVGTSVWRIARMFARGNIATTQIVIPEGLTIKQIKQLLMGTEELVGAVECSRDNNNVAVCNLKDGDIFPDTYRVARGTPRLAVLDLARKKMVALEQEMKGKKLSRPLKNWKQVVTLASIVQKETPRVSEMSTVASVYLNRLNKGMRLQADPTVVYALTNGLGDMQGKPLLRGHLKTESPYNTYMNKGLPPGPIANVGRDAVEAVLNPKKTNYLFFVADGQGGHRFSVDYAQHQKNHADWREIKKMKNKN